MKKIWLKNYPQNIPENINFEQYNTVLDIFNESCEKHKNKLAFSNMGHALTYQELHQKSNQISHYLQHTLGLSKGDRVAIMLPNLLQYPLMLFGILQAGLVVVNTNPLYTPVELAHQLNDAQVQAIIVLANFAHTLEAALPIIQYKPKHIIITQAGDCLPYFKKNIINFMIKLNPKFKKYNFNLYARKINIITFNLILNTDGKIKNNTVRNNTSITKNDIAFLQYTGGTTGIAKGAVLTHHNMVANMLQAKAWIHDLINDTNEMVITALPLYHIFSLTANCLIFLEIGGFNILITNPRDLNNFIKTIKAFKFTVMTGVNTLFNALLHHPRFKTLNFSRLKLTLGGGMAVQKTVAEQWEAITGCPILEAYGLTEASPAVTINPFNLKHYNASIGLPISSTDISIRDDHNHEQPVNAVGELCVKGPQVMQGYWNNPQETQKVLDPDGWLHTGDIAKVDPEGFVYIVDRKKDMINVSGFKVFPNEVENILVSHPNILEAGVIGVMDDNNNEVVKALVVKKNPALPLTPDDIIKFCHEKLTGYKIPRIIEFRDSLPKSTVGKILRRELR